MNTLSIILNGAGARAIAPNESPMLGLVAGDTIELAPTLGAVADVTIESSVPGQPTIDGGRIEQLGVGRHTIRCRSTVGGYWRFGALVAEPGVVTRIERSQARPGHANAEHPAPRQVITSLGMYAPTFNGREADLAGVNLSNFGG
jgi:hypothetical protein